MSCHFIMKQVLAAIGYHSKKIGSSRDISAAIIRHLSSNCLCFRAPNGGQGVFLAHHSPTWWAAKTRCPPYLADGQFTLLNLLLS
ncbi:hypothetical protein THIOM_003326 [Candidatus Thiomargarita nelsonii]|uniref:Uncharacterized protein n=1 Tax=Candidatus Thiomargarita nelsonii TaxID=1003181 RepID=A0A176RZ24_9GAMM|nr:hypothetical protein THIOM_003326 [Candidatus Thiomargarita nelsonii]